MSRNTETGRKKEQKEERLPEIHTDEEFEERLLWLLERRKAEKQRQIKRRNDPPSAICGSAHPGPGTGGDRGLYTGRQDTGRKISGGGLADHPGRRSAGLETACYVGG